MSADETIPPPEERLCKVHGKPITPSSWRNRKRNTGCSACSNAWRNSPQVRERRTLHWRNNFIACSKHPERRCNRSGYVLRRARFCSGCLNRRADGRSTQAYIRGKRKYAYKIAMRNRYYNIPYPGSLQGLALITRITGLQFSSTGALCVNN